MTLTTNPVASRLLNLPEELVLMLLNEESGYFYQVPGWNLNCAFIGSALAELSLLFRIDTDMENLYVLDTAKTGDPILDLILDEIAADPVQRNAQYWIERLAPRAESLIDSSLDRLVELKILEHHSGDYWTLAQTALHSDVFDPSQGTAVEFVKTRISRVVFSNEIPDPRDIIIICLIDTCDVFRFIFQLDDETEMRIKSIGKMDLIGRSIAAAVSHNLAGPLLRHSSLSKQIPVVSLYRLLRNPHFRDGNLPALFASLAAEYGPAFQIDPPFVKPLLFLAGPEMNQWAHRNGRMYLKTRDYFSDFEKLYGASGVLPSLDGADHFRLRKSLSTAYSRPRLTGQLDQLYRLARSYMADWNVGDTYSATNLCRLMLNAQFSPLSVTVDSQDLIQDLIEYKERAISTHIMGYMPKFMLKTLGMRRRTKAIDALVERIQGVHTSAQREGMHRNLADDILSLHASDPQLLPESNLRFALSMALIASFYLGDALSFALYAMASHPEIRAQIQDEANALFGDGDPTGNDFTPDAIDVTHRFLMECMRMYPPVNMSMRDVMNSCIVSGYELPVGTRIYIAQTASHYMPEVFPDPFTFDIDRYKDPRNEHRRPGYAPYGLGPHTCLGSRWTDLQLTVNILMIAHHFNVELVPADFQMKFRPIPSLKPSKKLKFRIASKRREIKL